MKYNLCIGDITFCHQDKDEMNTNIAHCGNTKISNFEQVGIDIILINCKVIQE